MEKFFIGLDIGTDSVGYAVTDSNFNLVRVKGQNAWGVRLLDESQTAAKRREYRSNRRRLERRKYRIKLLRSLFNDEIYKTDPSFFLRLDESMFHMEDKKLEGKYSLFFDKDFTDKDFYKKYPTIYHLRQSLMKSDEKFDLRLIYLACHHIIKYRGHFLYENDLGAGGGQIKDVFNKINAYITDYLYDEPEMQPIIYTEDKINKIVEVMSDKWLSASKKKEKILNILETKLTYHGLIIGALLGLKVSVEKLFNNENYKELEVSKIEFGKSGYDENDEPKLLRDLGEDYDFIAILKEGYQLFIYKKLLAGFSSVSDAMVNKYEMHEGDLKLLKKFIKQFYSKSDYFNLFKKVVEYKQGSIINSEQEGDEKSGDEDTKDKETKKVKSLGNYAYYIGMAKIKKKKFALEKCDTEDFYTFVKKLLETKKESLKEHPTYIEIMSKIESKSFMPKQLSKENSSIPYQLNKKELEIILNNAAKHYSFLNNVSDNLTVKEKIISLLTFRIPYYVGPLSNLHEHAWIVRFSNETITPWNFENVVDIDKTYENFIERLINNCTYLSDFKVIPKASLLYSEYLVLNELNVITVNGQRLAVDIKQRIFNELFKNNKSVTTNMLKKWLLQNVQFVEKDIVLSGFATEGKFTSNYASYITLKHILQSWVDENPVQCEELIKTITIYSQSKNVLEKTLRSQYPNFTMEQIHALKSVTFKDWARFSQEFLAGLRAKDVTSNLDVTVIELLRNTQQNLMEILNNNNYNFNELLLQAKKTYSSDKLDYAAVKELYCSPSVKRSIWQAMKVLEELISLIGHNPEKIFVEVGRSNKADKKQSKSRRNQILEFYNTLSNDDDLKKLKDELEKVSDTELRNEKIFLYFMQEGKCMYTNKELDLEHIGIYYDIDHIYPRSIIKDESLNNKVLVYSEANQKKSDDFPIRPEVQSLMKDFWNKLRQRGLLSDEKYNRLTRTSELSDSELEQFIHRQLVFTNQTNKEVINLIKAYYSDVKVIYSKAENVTDFRSEFELTKIRELNDLHHAKDAYLNIVVGNVLDVKFGGDYRKYIMNRNKLHTSDKEYTGLNIINIFKYNVGKPNNLVWEAEKSIQKIIDIFYRNDVLVSKQTVVNKGQLYGEKASKKGNDLMSVKSEYDERLLDTSKYGGYKDVKGAYFFIVKYTKGNKDIVYMEKLPILYKNQIDSKKLTLLQYCADILKLKNAQIIVPKINYYSLLRINNFDYYITAASKPQLTFNNATQLKISKDIVKLIKPMAEFYKIKELNKNSKNIKLSKKLLGKNNEKLSDDSAVLVYDYLCSKLNGAPYHHSDYFILMYKKLINAKHAFSELSLEDKCITIVNMLLTLNCKAITGNLSSIGVKTSRIRFMKNITGKSVYLITTSPTGLIKKQTKILSE